MWCLLPWEIPLPHCRTASWCRKNERSQRYRQQDDRILCFLLHLVALGMLAFSPLFHGWPDTSEEARVLATRFIMVQALVHASECFPPRCLFYLTFWWKRPSLPFVDSVFIWVVSVPVAFFLSHTDLYVVAILHWFRC